MPTDINTYHFHATFKIKGVLVEGVSAKGVGEADGVVVFGLIASQKDYLEVKELIRQNIYWQRREEYHQLLMKDITELVVKNLQRL